MWVGGWVMAGGGGVYPSSGDGGGWNVGCGWVVGYG